MEKTNLDVKFKGIDDFNQVRYKCVNYNVYLGTNEVLFPNKKIAPNNTKEEINNYFRNNLDKLLIFGNSFNCEPLGTRVGTKWNINIID